MQKIIKKMIKKRKIVVFIFIILILIAGWMATKVTINYEFAHYLSKDVPSTIGIEELKKSYTFTMPNARAAFQVNSISQALEYKEKLKETEGVTQVLWLDDTLDLETPLELQDPDTVKAFYTGDTALFQITADTKTAPDVLQRIYDLQENVKVSGQLIDLANAQLAVQSEIYKITLVVVPLVLIVLLFSTHAWLEPLIFGLTIGVGIILNSGTNLFLGDVSFITQSVASILQLAVSMDYAIFLLNRFNQNRRLGHDPEKAMTLAVREAFTAVSSSAMTTVFGFLALIFMRFKIGPDLGIVMAKGILFSFLSVIIFMPCFMLLVYRLVDKTTHRPLLPNFEFVGRFLSKAKIVFVILFLVLAIPGFLGSRANHFLYGIGGYPSHSRMVQDKNYIDQKFGRQQQFSLLVPKGHIADELSLLHSLEEKDDIISVITYSNQVDPAIPQEILDDSKLDMLLSDQYSQFIIAADIPTEGAKTFQLVEEIRAEAEKLYPGAYHLIGETVSLYDMKTTVEQDNLIVNGLAILAIALVILLAFRSISLSVILVLSIEIAIWINLSIPYFTGVHLSYLGYLIISTVQLGATVDYAILYTSHYLENRKAKLKSAALMESTRETLPSLLPPALILTVAGFALKIISSLPIVSELGLILGRGAFLSFLSVVLFLPGLLFIFDRVIEKTSIGIHFIHRADLIQQKTNDHKNSSSEENYEK